MGKKIILVGDHKQLPHMLEPDVVKRMKEDPNFKDFSALEQSLFERLYDMFSKEPKPRTVMLNEQFRMHPDICKFVSEQFYEGELKMSPSANLDLYKSHPEINGGRALAFIDIPNSEGPEKPGRSMSRNIEATKISEDVVKILNKVPNATIGIISFYSAQVSLINDCLSNKINNEQKSQVEVGTVDAFQGKEYDYVLLSCVRSFKHNTQKKHSLEFLDKPNRLCVSFSRSKKQLAVYGDAQCLKPIESINALYRVCAENNGGYYHAL
jgi:superfamily I DNA and/or RNA helicase